MGRLRIASLGSGSSGNAVLVCSTTTRLLLDCGFTLKDTTRRLEALGVHPGQLDAVLLSHEHGDHVRGVGPLCRRFNVPLYTTHGTFASLRDRRISSVHVFDPHAPFMIGDIEVDPFPTMHDAREPCQYVFEHGGARFACATDLGVPTPHVMEKLSGVHGLLLECNYDDELLRTGPYPPSLQARIRSNFGHLGNLQAAALASAIDHPGLALVLLGHLSEQNNAPQVALDTLCAALPNRQERARVLNQHEPSEWFVIQSEAQALEVSEANPPRMSLA